MSAENDPGVMMTTNPENNAREFSREYELRVGNLATPIRLRIYRSTTDGKLLIEQSHFIKTAIQYLPYAVDEVESSDEAAVVGDIERTLAAFYDQAVRRGYIPSESWLVPNSGFDKR